MMITRLSILFLHFILVLGEPTQVQLKFGNLFGTSSVLNGITVNTFLGVPYATPPVKELRFKKPQPYSQKWEQPFDATKWPNICPQVSLQASVPYSGKPSEDCLHLNIWTPHSLKDSSEKESLKPVLVYVHGGAFFAGSSSLIAYEGSKLAATGDIVVVTINYRLGPLGFLYGNDEDAPPNVGLWDQLVALEWIQDNIAYFGGNPRDVTLSGESAGAISVSMHLLSPLATHLFDKAIAFSGFAFDGFAPITKDLAIRRASIIATVSGCRKDESIGLLTQKEVDCLREIEVEKLVKAQFDPKVVFINETLDFWPFRPLYGDAFLPLSPLKAVKEGRYKTNTSLLIGTVINEGITFEKLTLPFRKLAPPKTKSDFVQQTELAFENTDIGCPSPPREVLESVYYANIKEDDLKAARDTHLSVLGDVSFDCPTNLFAEYLSKTNDVYQYLFAPPVKMSIFCKNGEKVPCHADDVLYTFNAVLGDPTQVAIADEWNAFLFKFIKGEELPVSKHSFTKSGRSIAPYYIFRGNNNNEIGHGHKNYECGFWRDSFFEKLKIESM